MKRNTHRIYYIGNLKFLVVRKEEGVYPASWQRVVFTYEQLWDEIKNLGFNYYMWKFKNDHKFWMAFKAADTPEEFIQNVRKLMKETKVNGNIHEFNEHTRGKGLLIYDYAKTRKLFVLI